MKRFQSPHLGNRRVAQCPMGGRGDATRQQQQFLELALLDLSDREIQEWLGLSDETLKKRWHSTYARVRQSDPDLLPEGLPGADQRRVLLGYLRQHPEELRPIASR